MSINASGQIKGACSGYHGGAIFRLTNGQVWQQSRYRYRCRYAYRPHVMLFGEGGRQMLRVDGIGEAVEVRQARILVEGPIVSKFNGFNQDSIFQFANGQTWRPAEYKYHYHYAYRPDAMVIDGVDGTTLHVDGMSETLRVRRA